MNDTHFVKKSVRAVQAFQMTQERIWDNSEWPQWLHTAWNMYAFEQGAMWRGSGAMERAEDGKAPAGEGGLDYFMINKGNNFVDSCVLNDWIVRHGECNLFVVLESEFRSSYKPIDDLRND